MLLTAVRAAAVVFGVITLTFVLLHLAPGDPVQRILGPAATPGQIAAGRHGLGLDRPWPVQYADWVGHMLHGDFGRSIASGRSVSSLLAHAWPATAILVLLSLGATYAIAIVIGAWQANTQSRAVDGAVTIGSIAVASLPSYWLGLVLVMIFTYRLRLLPAFGATGLDVDFLGVTGRAVDLVRHAILPLATLTLIGVGGVARFVRAGMRDLRGAPFLAVARSKGLSRWHVTVRHQLRNALVPLITLLGLSLPALFSGTVFVEAIFAWPGVGQLLVQGVQARDYPVVMAGATVAAVLVVTGNLLAELLVHMVDPRSRRQGVRVA
jgi:peptide/nickel transport system permease protein